MTPTCDSVVSPRCGSATTWRNDVATGASPWNVFPPERMSPEGTAGDREAFPHVAPAGLRVVSHPRHGLAPVATTCRPCGTPERVLHRASDAPFAESSRLEAAIRSNLEGLGYGG